jgi:hypothetical protein
MGTVGDVMEPGAGAACRCPRFRVKVAEDMRRRGWTAEGKSQESE